jgi:hypothetical protein
VKPLIGTWLFYFSGDCRSDSRPIDVQRLHSDFDRMTLGFPSFVIAVAFFFGLWSLGRVFRTRMGVAMVDSANRSKVLRLE